MYLSPINYQPRQAIANFGKQKYNPKFEGRNSKGLQLATLGLVSSLSVPLVKNRVCASDTDKPVPTIESIIEANKKKVKPKRHHPDYYKIEKDGYEILASSYFRRGGMYGSPDERYVDVINALRTILKPSLISFFKDNKVKMLIGGVGESQEPYSLLATAKNIMGKEKLNDYLDTYTVDLQAQPDNDTIFKQSFYDSWGEPEFVKSSFVPDDATKYDLPGYKKYRVSDEIYEYLLNTYNNKQQSKWKTRIQDALKEYPDREFDIVSINNTLIYLKGHEEILEAVKNVYRTLRRGGIFISDNRLTAYSEVFTPENSIEIYPGIYQKL